jgi:Flp pilus assembly protein TadB
VTVVVLGALAAAGAWLATSSVPRGRVPVAGAPETPPSAELPERSRRWLWSVLAGLGGWGFVSGVAGVVVGAVAACVVWVVLARAESPVERRRRERVRTDLPHVVGLLAAAVRAGLPPAEGIAVVSAALPGPAADALARLPPRIALGVDPAEAWRLLERDPSLAPLGRTLARSARTGEPVADALDRLGHELSARARAEVEDAARRVGVRAAVPLGLCLLPSFLLLGIVPVVAGLVSALGG